MGRGGVVVNGALETDVPVTAIVMFGTCSVGRPRQRARQRVMAACPEAQQTLTHQALSTFVAADAGHLAKRAIEPSNVRSLDGSPCKARTADGVALAYDGKCADLGETYTFAAAMDESHGHTPLTFLPNRSSIIATANREALRHADGLRSAIEALQFPAGAASLHCGRQVVDRPTYYMHVLPQVGFGSVIEYTIMFLARGLAIGAPVRLGPDSSVAWTSKWFCGARRSVTCYFNLSSCCAVMSAHGQTRPLMLPRRRDPINVAARGFNEYGSAWVSAQLARFLFDRMTPPTRAQLDRRRSGTLYEQWMRPHAAGGGERPLVIGMHIRRGDSCHKRRYCPSNLTSSYFAAAAKLRAVYGANRLLLATDDAEAARLCAQHVLGFECTTQSIERRKFESAELIENRVAQHEAGDLSGSTVALDALADIDMLADCDMFVLLLRSCFARVAYALAMGRKGRPPPVISLEAPWSPHRGFKAKAMSMAMRNGHGGKAAMMRHIMKASMDSQLPKVVFQAP